MRELARILPGDLTGPRSYFTDIDPDDSEYDAADAIRKLKLQLLTKERVLIAASSLFHDVGYKVVKGHLGLVTALENGIIVPTIRNQFDGIQDFFDYKKVYSDKSREFFIAHTSHSVPWDLEANTTWFKSRFFDALADDQSVLRKRGRIDEEQASGISTGLAALVADEPAGGQFLQRRHIEEIAHAYSERTATVLVNYGNLIYRLSGARVVNAEGHFPQSNLTKLGITGSESVLSEEGIFWDIYVETVFSYLGTAIRLDAERLDRLKFEDILKIRRSLFDVGFSTDYDELIGSVKDKADIRDPDRLLLDTQEICRLAVRLRMAFADRVASELPAGTRPGRGNALWQVANVLALLASPATGLIVGVVSALRAIPEITALLSPALASSLDDRLKWMCDFVNTRVGWSSRQRRSFLDAFKELALYGLENV